MSNANYWGRFTRERLGRRRLLKSGASLSMGAAALALIGCGNDDDNGDSGGSGTASTPASGNTPAASGGPKKGGRLTFSNIGAGADSSANPITANRAGHILAAQHVYDHLISTRVGAKSPYILEAAEKLEQPDDLTIIFTLKAGLKYQDISPVNGRDVKASDLKAVHELVRDTATANRSFQTTSMESVEAPDDRTIVFHLQKPNAYLLTGTQLGEVANGSMIPVEILDQLDSHKSIGSGPYQEMVNDVGVKVEYRRFDGFRDADKVYIDERFGILFGDAVAQQTAFISGQTDVLQPPPSDPTVDDVVAALGDDIYKQAYPTLAPFTLNIGGSMEYNPIKADIRAREGFYRSINRQQFIDLVFNSKGTIPSGLLVDGLEDYLLDPSETEQFFKQDLAEARKLFEAAGVLDAEHEVMYFAPNDINAQTCQIMQTQLREVGLRTTIQGVPTSEGFEKATRGEWQLFAGGHPAYASPQIILRQQHSESGSRFGFTGLGDAEIDALVEQSEAATDFEENVRLVKEVQRVSLQKYTGYYLLTSRTVEQLLYKRVMDWENDPSETYLPRIEAWLDT